MALPILSELNQELTRLFVAGSRLCVGDPRVRKYIAPLTQLGAKAPVFLKLARLVEELVGAEPSQSAGKLLETESFLLSILGTQGETVVSGQLSAIGSREEGDAAASVAQRYITLDNPQTSSPYRTLAPVLEALSKSGAGRMKVLSSAQERGVFRDPRVIQPAADALSESIPDMTDFLIGEVLPSIGKPAFPCLLEAFDMNGNNADGRRLKAMYKLAGDEALTIAEESFASGSAPVKIEAAQILADFPCCETLLLGGLTDVKAVREAAMKALIRMDSHQGIDKILSIYREKPDSVNEIITEGTSPHLIERVLETARERYAPLSAGNAPKDDLEMFANSLELLRRKQSQQIADFLTALLVDGHLDSYANTALKRSEKLSDTCLDILYNTGHGENFIWEMFQKTQQGFVGKLLGGKKNASATPLMLPVYAFAIGARRLDAERFFDMFFKSGLYKEIKKLDGLVFQKNFSTEGREPPPVSSRMARWFMVNDEMRMAVRTVYLNDTNTLNELADHMQSQINKNYFDYSSYNILLERLGQAKHKRFAPLYKFYCEKSPSAQRADLDKYLS